MGIINLLTAFSGVFLVDKVGRRIMLIEGIIGMGMCWFLLFVLVEFKSEIYAELTLIVIFVVFF